MLTPKELKKLVKTCREAGIKHFKNNEFEFTLSDVEPIKPSKKASGAVSQGEIESDELSEEAKLFWSAAGGTPMYVGDGE